jgi:hypothetical protein
MAHKTIWEGRLAIGARKLEYFDAEIVERGNGMNVILSDASDGGVHVVDPNEISGDVWLSVVVALAKERR